MRKRVRLRRRRAVEEAEIVVIPMIDVMMFLLFFFMVASLAMATASGLPVDLPKASTSNQHPAENVTITIMRNGAIYLNTRRTTMTDIEAGLQRLNVAPTSLIIINADTHVEHGVVVGAMDQARKAGITRFAIATDQS